MKRQRKHIHRGLPASTRFIFTLLASWLLTSCISTSKLQKKVPVSPDPVTNASFNGVYVNRDDPQQRSLWTILHTCKTRKRDMAMNSDSGTVSLKLEGQLLHVQLYHRDSLMSAFDLSVRQQGNYLFIKRRFLLVPIPFLFYSYREVVAVLSEERGALNVQYGDDQLIWVLFAGSRESRSLYKYSKTSDTP